MLKDEKWAAAVVPYGAAEEAENEKWSLMDMGALLVEEGAAADIAAGGTLPDRRPCDSPQLEFVCCPNEGASDEEEHAVGAAVETDEQGVWTEPVASWTVPEVGWAPAAREVDDSPSAEAAATAAAATAAAEAAAAADDKADNEVV